MLPKIFSWEKFPWRFYFWLKVIRKFKEIPGNSRNADGNFKLKFSWVDPSFKGARKDAKKLL